VRDAFIFAAWRSIVGEQVFDRTAPLLVDEKRLVIAVSDKTWKRNLETLASQLLFKLNACLGKPLIDFIEFRVAPDAIEVPDRTTDEMARATVPPVELSISARKIRDESLRETVLKAAANCISRRK
jgi:hypothetical protein